MSDGKDLRAILQNIVKYVKYWVRILKAMGNH